MPPRLGFPEGQSRKGEANDGKSWQKGSPAVTFRQQFIHIYVGLLSGCDNFRESPACSSPKARSFSAAPVLPARGFLAVRRCLTVVRRARTPGSLPLHGKAFLSVAVIAAPYGWSAIVGISQEHLEGVHDLGPLRSGGARYARFPAMSRPIKPAGKGASNHLSDHPHAGVVIFPAFK